MRSLARSPGLVRPPSVAVQEGWDGLYIEQAFGLDVLPDVASAVEWANELIALISEA